MCEMHWLTTLGGKDLRAQPFAISTPATQTSHDHRQSTSDTISRAVCSAHLGSTTSHRYRGKRGP